MFLSLQRSIIFIFVLQLFTSVQPLTFGQRLDDHLYDIDCQFRVSKSFHEKKNLVLDFLNWVINELRSDPDFNKDNVFYSKFDWYNQIILPLFGYLKNIQEGRGKLYSSLGNKIKEFLDLILNEKVDTPASAKECAEDVRKNLKIKISLPKQVPLEQKLDSAMVNGLLQKLNSLMPASP